MRTDAGRRYLLVTPCRNEAAYLETTIASVAAQTVLPARWIVVDDGSTDGTSEVLAEASRTHAWIEVITRDDRGERSVGPGVIEAFYAGLERVDLDDYDYVCKFDGDLEMPPAYFQTMLERMEAEPRLGTCSGKPYYRDEATGRLVSERCGDEMSVGMVKFYRVTCFRQIGGFVRQVMWDGIDCHRCRMLGWIARSWDEPAIRFIHLRPMGSSFHGVLRGRRRHGFGQYFMGTSLPYMTASAVFRMTRPPYVSGGLAMWWGYVWSMLRRLPRYDDLAFRAFLRRYQRDCLLRGKSAATARLDERQASAWSPPAAGTPRMAEAAS